MIPYTGEPMHYVPQIDGAAVLAWLAQDPRAPVSEERRCVGCDKADGGERGWCDPCWQTTLHPEPA